MSEGASQSELVEELRRAFSEELDRRNRVDAETHRAHHDFIRQQIECRERRRELALSVAKHVLGLMSALGLGWLGSLVLRGLSELFSKQ